MPYSSSLRASSSRHQFESPAIGESLISAGLSPTIIRFAGHLPYFKLGSALMLPQALSLSGVAATTLAYSLVCLAVTRWLGNRHSPWLCTLALIAIMMVVGPAIAALLPGGPVHPAELPGGSSSLSSMWVAYLGLLLPVSGGFLAIQVLMRSANRRSN